MWFLFLVAVSCSKKGFEADGFPVEFDARDYSAEVRAESSASDFATGDSFGVMAYYIPSGATWSDYSKDAVPDFMYNQMVSYDGLAWSYSPTMYWPQIDGARVNFYAYYPYSDGVSETGVKVSSSEEMGMPSFEFVLDETAGVDLMVAKAEGCTSSTGSVYLPFRHLLGKVQFKFAVSAKGGFSYVVNKIKVLSTPKSAEYDWGTDHFSVLSNAPIEASAGPGTEGYLIDTMESVLIKDFTMFLMPGKLGGVQVSLNNEEDSVTLDLSQVYVESGKVLTVSVIICLSNVDFEAELTDWKDGGTADKETIK